MPKARTPQPPKALVQQFVQAWARQKHVPLEGVHIKVHTRLYDAYMKLYNQIVEKYPHIDMLSDEARRLRDEAADKWWRSRIYRGAGVDW